MTRIIRLAVFISSIVATGTILCLTPRDSGYLMLPLLPFTYLIVYSLLLEPGVISGSIFVYGFSSLSFFRYIVLPFLISYTGTYQYNYYGFVNINNSRNYSMAVMLMTYELIMISLCTYVALRMRQKSDATAKVSSLGLTGNRYIYYVLVILALLLILTVPSIKDNFSIFMISIRTGSRISETLSPLQNMLRQVVITGIILTYLLIVDSMKRKYEINKSIFFVAISIIAAFINISIIVGERRAYQVYTAFCSGYILMRQFGKFKRHVISVIVIITLTVILGMTVYKNFYAFKFDSYVSAISGFSVDGSYITNVLQSYLQGPGNVALALQMKQDKPNTSFNTAYDIARSTIGLSYFVKNLGENYRTANEIFNTYIYKEYRSAGHILSAISYGYINFGFILAPLLSCLLVIGSVILENSLGKTSSLEITYLVTYILMRVILSIFANITLAINGISVMLISLGLISLVAISYNKLSGQIFKT